MHLNTEYREMRSFYRNDDEPFGRKEYIQFVKEWKYIVYGFWTFIGIASVITYFIINRF